MEAQFDVYMKKGTGCAICIKHIMYIFFSHLILHVDSAAISFFLL